MDIKIERNVSLAGLTTFRIGGPASYFCVVKSAEELLEATSFAVKEKLPIFVLGGGSNLLVFDRGFQGLVIKNEILGIEFLDETRNEVAVNVGSGESWDGLVALLARKNLWGLENLSFIPGTVGGAVVQNAGAYGIEQKDCFENVEVFDTKSGKVKTLSKKDCEFGYRESVFKRGSGERYFILSARYLLKKKAKPRIDYGDLREAFKAEEIGRIGIAQVRDVIGQIRSKKLPNLNETGTAGSFFKNPIIGKKSFDVLKKKYPALAGFPQKGGRVKISLAWVIDNLCDMKGVRQGKIGVYEKHSLVLVNYGGATFKDTCALAEKIRESVHNKISIDPEQEVVVVQ